MKTRNLAETLLHRNYTHGANFAPNSRKLWARSSQVRSCAVYCSFQVEHAATKTRRLSLLAQVPNPSPCHLLATPPTQPRARDTNKSNTNQSTRSTTFRPYHARTAFNAQFIVGFNATPTLKPASRTWNRGRSILGYSTVVSLPGGFIGNVPTWCVDCQSLSRLSCP